MQQPLYAIIVAGGSGTRMKTDIPKQFIPIGKKPILMHTVDAFLQFKHPLEVILVLPEHEIQTWENLCLHYGIDQKKIKVVAGGASRFHSVANGLAAIDGENGLVAIHDGVRPFVTQELLATVFQQAAEYGNAIVAVPPKDSIRVVDEEGNASVDRANYRLVQTPQTFQLSLIKAAFEHATHIGQSFTDDASVLEVYGGKIHLVEGIYENIKITTPEDLALAEALLKKMEGR